MSGDTGAILTPPLNAPPGSAPQPGVQPGTSGVVLATQVIVIGPTGQVLVIGTNVPQVILTFYNVNYGASIRKAWIGEYVDANNFHYEIWGSTGGITAFHANGWVNNGTVREEVFDYFDGTQITYQLGLINNVFAQWIGVKINGGDFGGGFCDLIWDNVSISRGVQQGVRATSTTTVVTTGTTELNLPQLALPQFNAYLGRQYTFGGRIMVQQSVGTDQFDLRIRRDTALTGTQVGFVRFSVQGGPISVHIDGTFTPAANDAPLFFLSLVRASGTGTCTFTPRVSGGNAQLSSFFYVSDESSAPGVNQSPWTTT